MKILFFDPPFSHNKTSNFNFKECNGGFGLTFDFGECSVPKLPITDLLLGVQSASDLFDVNILSYQDNEDWTEEDFLSYIESKRYDVIFIRSSWPSIYSDNKWALNLKKRQKVSVVGFGPIFESLNVKNLSYDFTVGENVYDLDWKTLARSIQFDRQLKFELSSVNRKTNFKKRIKYEDVKYEYSENYIFSSLGCPIGCSYCSYTLFNNGKVKNKTIDDIIKELSEYQLNNIKTVNFRDPSFNIFPSRVYELCDEIIKKKISIKWSCEVILNRLNSKLIYKMVEAGCVSVRFAIESFNLTNFKYLNRPSNFNNLMVSEANIKRLQSLGVSTHAFFIIGLPSDCVSSICSQQNWALSSGLNRVQFLNVNFYPKTKLFENKILNRSLDMSSIDSMATLSYQTSTQNYPYYSLSKVISPARLDLVKRSLYYSLDNNFKLTPDWILNNNDIPRQKYLSHKFE